MAKRPSLRVVRLHCVHVQVGAVMIASLMLGACAQTSNPFSLTASDGAAVETTRKPGAGEIQQALTYWATKFAQNPANEKAALSFARNLRFVNEKKKAFAVLQRASMANGGSRTIASEYGRLALELGQVKLAQKMLERAHDPAKPDWRILSAQGAAMARLGDHKGAQDRFQRALALKPGHPSILNNLAMSHALDGNAIEAEKLLRKASIHSGDKSRVKQNLALVLGLQGKFNEAEDTIGNELAREKVLANVAYLQQMVDNGNGAPRAFTPAYRGSTEPAAQRSPTRLAQQPTKDGLRGGSAPTNIKPWNAQVAQVETAPLAPPQ